MTDLTDQLDAIQAQLYATTPGPWARSDYVDLDEDGSYDLAHVTAPDPDEPDTAVLGVAMGILRPDAVFIAAAPANIGFLLVLARKQQAAIDAVKVIERRLEASMQCEDREIAEDLREALEAKP